MNISVKELLQMDADLDVFNDMTQDICPAFTGRIGLTEDGEEKFRDILDLQCDVCEEENRCVLLIKSLSNWEEVWRKASNFFSCAAGYCAYEEWLELFY